MAGWWLVVRYVVGGICSVEESVRHVIMDNPALCTTQGVIVSDM